MASGISDYLANAILNLAYGNTAFSPPATVYVGLYTARGTPAQASSNTNFTHVTGGAYARVAVTNNTTNFPVVADMDKVNGIAIAFPMATASWGTILGGTVYDAASGGNLLHWGDLDEPLLIEEDDTFLFPVGNLHVMEGICP